MKVFTDLPITNVYYESVKPFYEAGIIDGNGDLKNKERSSSKKYVGVDVKTTSNKELVLQVVGDEEYLKSVKMDMEFITKGVIKNTELEDYMVVFERWE